MKEKEKVNAYREMEDDLKKKPSERRRGILNFPECYDLLEIDDVEEMSNDEDDDGADTLPPLPVQNSQGCSPLNLEGLPSGLPWNSLEGRLNSQSKAALEHYRQAQLAKAGNGSGFDAHEFYGYYDE